MNTYHLKYFLDAAKAGSMSASAQKNNITHSAISQAIKSLENELGIELLNHHKRRFELTDSAKAALKPLEELLLEIQQVKASLISNQAEPAGDCIVWAPHSLIVDSLIDCFVSFQKKYPRVNLIIQTGAAFLVRQSVAENRCHLGIAINDHEIKHMSSMEMAKGEFVLVSAKSDVSMSKEPILISSFEKIEVQHLINENIRIKNPHFLFNTQIVSWGLIREFTLRGHGIGYVPEYVVKNDLKQKKLFKVPWSGKPFKYEVTAIWNKKHPLERNAQLLLDMIEKKRF